MEKLGKANTWNSLMASRYSVKLQADSLQQLCMISIMNNLEQYSDEYLSLLPNKLRFEILRRLPVVDICRLENSSFIDGLDTSIIWEELYEKHYSRYVEPVQNRLMTGIKPQQWECLRYRWFQFRDHFDDSADCYVKSKDEDMKQCYLSMISNIILNDARPSGYWEVSEKRYEELVDFYGMLEEEHDWITIDRCIDTVDVSDPIEYVPDDIVNYLVAVERAVLFNSPVKSKPSRCVPRESIDDDCYDYNNALTCGKTESRKPSEHYIQACQTRQYVPCRYSSMLEETQCRISDGCAISLLMTRCNYRPTTVVLSKYWLGQHGLRSKSCSEVLLTDFLSKVSSLNLRYTCISSSSDPVNLTVSSKNSCLSALSISGSDKIVETISYLYRFVMVSITPSFKSLLQNMTELEVTGYSTGYVLHTPSEKSKLATIIENLSGLESLKIKVAGLYPEFRGKVEVDILFTQLKRFINRPRFRSLTVQCLRMSFVMCQKLMQEFIAKSCSVEQSLCLEPLIFFPGSKRKPEVIESAERSYEFKSLHLHTEFALSLLLPLLEQQPTIHLNCLEISGGDVSKLEGLPSLYTTLAAHRDVRVQTLIIRNRSETEIPSEEQTEAIECLFQNPFLQHLTIADTKLVHYIEALTRGLLKQANVNTLCELNLSADKFISFEENLSMDMMSLAQHTAFFNALFSLPKLEELNLSLDFPWYRPNMDKVLNELYLSWKECSRGKHLRNLELRHVFGISKELVDHLREMGASF